MNEISLSKAYNEKLPLPSNKTKDLNNLMENNIIPKFYKHFYDSIL